MLFNRLCVLRAAYCVLLEVFTQYAIRNTQYLRLFYELRIIGYLLGSYVVQTGPVYKICF